MFADPRRWLLDAARRSSGAPSQWVRQVVTRRSIVVAAVAGAALAGGLLGQGLWQAPARPAVIDVTQLSPAQALPSGSVVASGAPSITGGGATAAQNSLSGLERPGYLLTNSAAAALAEVRATVSDAVALQQLRAQILAPTSGSGLTSAALSDLVSLVRQAQISSALALAALAPTQPLDSTALTQAQADVRAAQAALLQATKARDESALATTAIPSATATTSTGAATPLPASASAVASPQAVANAAAPTVAPTAKPADPAVIHDAQARLATAQQQLQALLAGSPSDQVNAAEQAVTQALAATPPAPGDDALAAAKAAVDRAQKDFDAANQPVASSVAVAARNAAAVPRSTVVSRAQSTPDAPVAAVGQQQDNQRLIDTKANLDSANAALAKLEQQAAVAADPESQPAVKAARAHAAALQATPNAADVASARAVVASIQQQITTLQGGTLVGTASPPTAVSVRAPATAAAASTPTGLAPVPGVAGAVAAASSSVATAQPLDPVTLAEQQLAAAQKRVHDLISPPGSDATGAAAQSLAATQSIAGSTVTAPSPEVLAAQTQLATAGQVNPHDLTAIEVGLRATYVMAAVLKVERLHPSALAFGATTSLAKPVPGSPSATLAWPVKGPVTQPFGVPELGVGAPHTGIDIGVGVGTPVLASASGVVSFAGGDPAIGYGYYAIIDHGAGVSTLYGHLALPPLVHQGQFLPSGGLIGLSGSTGFSTGPHVHFEVRLNGVPADPLRVLLASGH
jgi:murein DD-endopeptidase MepM/ murein hydrolase activator NlpD